MRKIAIACLALLFVVCACEPAPPPPPPTPPPPPPPSPQEIAAEIRPCLSTYSGLLTEPGQPLVPKGFSDGMQKQAYDCLSAAKSKHQVTDNGKEALAIITHELEDIIKRARDEERWHLVLGVIASHTLLAGESEKYRRLKDLAEKMTRKPIVNVKGFFDDEENKQTYVFLEFQLKPTNEVVQERMRIGEEKHEVKLLDVVGNKKGVRLEYVVVPGTIWERLAP